MGNYEWNAKGLRICAIIWLVLLLLGSLVSAIIVWSNSSYGYYSYGYYGRSVDGGLVALGFGIWIGGSFFAVLSFFFLSCIADIANESYFHSVTAHINDDKNIDAISKGVSNALENKKELFERESPQQDNIADELPNL